MKTPFQVYPVGAVRIENESAHIVIDASYRDAISGLEGFSHIQIFWWFHENDTPDQRATLQVHPRKDKNNPLTGVFATHSPTRPNLIAMSTCRVLAIRDGVIKVEKIDAWNGSPVLDIKPHIPVESLKNAEIRLPAWAAVVENRSE